MRILPSAKGGMRDLKTESKVIKYQGRWRAFYMTNSTVLKEREKTKARPT